MLVLRAGAATARFPPMPVHGGAGATIVFVMLATALGCGDPGDVEVPIVPVVAPPDRAPTFAAARAQAFASIDIRGSEDSSVVGCPIQYTSTLGQSCERIAPNSSCSAVRDGKDGVVQCALRPHADAPGTYDVELELEHELLPRLTVVGPMREAATTHVALHVTTPERSEFDADCLGEGISLKPSVVQFRLTACAGRVDGKIVPSCFASVTAGFENCKP
jgi:hypothetical protein